MAVIKYSGLVDQLRGKLNGTVFSRFHAGFNTYKKGQPKRWGSSDQQKLRQSLAIAASAWPTLTPQERQDWAYIAANTTVTNRLGEQVLIPGFQYFLKYQQYRATIGLPRSYSVNQDLVKPYSLTITPNFLNTTQNGRNYSIENANMFFEITANSPATTELMLYISNPLSHAGASYYSTFYYINNVPLPGNLGLGYSSAFQRGKSEMPQGWYTYQGAKHLIIARPVNFASAQTAPAAIAEFTSNFTPPPPPVWPLTITFHVNATRYTRFALNGSTWEAAGTGIWVAITSQYLSGLASDYEFELAMSPNYYTTDIARPDEFTTSRPTLSGMVYYKADTGTPILEPAEITDLQNFMNANFTYDVSDNMLYQPVAIRIKNPVTNEWTAWAYSNIWLRIP